MKKRTVLIAAALVMMLASTAALAQTEPGGPIPEDELLCLLPEGCDTTGDGAPDLGAGDPVPGGEPGAVIVQYDNTL